MNILKEIYRSLDLVIRPIKAGDHFDGDPKDVLKPSTLAKYPPAGKSVVLYVLNVEGKEAMVEGNVYVKDENSKNGTGVSFKSKVFLTDLNKIKSDYIKGKLKRANVRREGNTTFIWMGE